MNSQDSGKKCRVKVRTKSTRKRKGFCKKKIIDDQEIDLPGDDTSVISNIDDHTVTDGVIGDIVRDDIDMNVTAGSSVSSSKVENISDSIINNPISGYRLIDMELLSSMFSGLLCPECYACTLTLSDVPSKKKGLASLLTIKCSSCGHSVESYTSKISTKDKTFDINYRAVYAMRECGQGHSSLDTLCSLLNMPSPMVNKAYTDIIHKISDAVKDVCHDTMVDAIDELRIANNVVDKDKCMNIPVSCDGSWQRRGYSSNNGIVTIISMQSGKVLDLETMSKHCKACALKENLRIADPIAYDAWKVNHSCSFNYQGSPGGMESEGAKRIWQRSIANYNVQYSEFYGDGDSKAFESVKDVYDDIVVKKLECVGHVQKRVGTRIRTLKKKEKGLGGRGKLTDSTVDRLQNYYGIAIRGNKNNLEAMQRAIRATLFHVASSKDNNLHYPHCPEGSDSWCTNNKDRADGTNTHKPGPGLPLDIVFKLRPIYAELSDEKLLSKCLHGLTQNHNESFNGTIWERIPKNNFVGLRQLELGAFSAAAHFNIGRKASVLVLEKLGLIPGKYLVDGCRKINQKRIYLAEYKSKDTSKKRRKVIRGNKKLKSDSLKRIEGGKLYKTGAF